LTSEEEFMIKQWAILDRYLVYPVDERNPPGAEIQPVASRLVAATNNPGNCITGLVSRQEIETRRKLFND
jgi:hypothetical protein